MRSLLPLLLIATVAGAVVQYPSSDRVNFAGGISLGPVTFVNLPRHNVADTSMLNCRTCAATDPCTDGGAGTLAFFYAGDWHCNGLAGGVGQAAGTLGQVQYHDYPTNNFAADFNFFWDPALRQLVIGTVGGTNDGTIVSICTPGMSDCHLSLPENSSDLPTPASGNMEFYPVDHRWWQRDSLGVTTQVASIKGGVTAQTYACFGVDGYLFASAVACTTATTTTTIATTTTATTTSTTTVTTTTGATTTATTSTTTTTTLNPAISTNWGPSSVAWWKLDEAVNTTRAKHAGTCTTTHCDLVDHSATDCSQDTTGGQFMEGTASMTCASANSAWRGCNESTTCNSLNINLNTNNASWCAWIRPNTISVLQSFLDNAGTTGGYGSFVDAANHLNCTIISTTGVSTPAVTSSATLANNTFVHQCCTYSFTTGAMRQFVNGTLDGTATRTPANESTSNATEFELGGANAGTPSFNGQIDEAVVFTRNIADVSACKICSCGLEGTLCRCDSTTPTSYATSVNNGVACTQNSDCQDGTTPAALCNLSSNRCEGRRGTSCGGCTLSACNRATP